MTTATYAPLGQLGGGAKVQFVPVDKVLARLENCFVEPLERVVFLPAYAGYEKACADFKEWPSSGEPLVLLTLNRRKPEESWGVISGLHVLAAAKNVCKVNVPCFFIRRDQVSEWQRANAGGGLIPPGASPTAEDEEEALYRAYWPD